MFFLNLFGIMLIDFSDVEISFKSLCTSLILIMVILLYDMLLLQTSKFDFFSSVNNLFIFYLTNTFTVL